MIAALGARTHTRRPLSRYRSVWLNVTLLTQIHRTTSSIVTVTSFGFFVCWHSLLTRFMAQKHRTKSMTWPSARDYTQNAHHTKWHSAWMGTPKSLKLALFLYASNTSYTLCVRLNNGQRKSGQIGFRSDWLRIASYILPMIKKQHEIIIL